VITGRLQSVRFSRGLAVLLLACLAGRNASGEVCQSSLEKKVAESDLIARVQVLSVRESDTPADYKSIAEAEVTESIKGLPKGRKFELEFDDGSLSSNVLYQTGDDCLLFAIRRNNGRYATYNDCYGKLPIREHKVQPWLLYGKPDLPDRPVHQVIVEVRKLLDQVGIEAGACRAVERYAGAHQIDLAGLTLRYARRVIRTREGKALGIDIAGQEFRWDRQIVTAEEKGPLDDVGYRLWAAMYGRPQEPLPEADGATFDPAIEREMTFFDHSKPSNYLDLDTGKYVDPKPPGDLGTRGMDLTVSLGESDSRIRCAVDMVVAPVDDSWWSRTAGDVLRAISRKKPRGHVRLSMGMTSHQATWLFRTREGGAGVLRIATGTDPRKALVLYKLIRGTSAAARPGVLFWIDPQTAEVVSVDSFATALTSKEKR